MNINSEAQKDPVQLEREIDESRAHMGSTLSALEEKLSPERLIDQVVDYARKNSGEFSQNLVETIKHNPVPAILTAVGVAWLIFGQNKSSSYDNSYDASSYDTDYDAYGEGFSDSAGTTKSGIKEQAKQLKDNLSNSISGVKNKALGTVGSVRNQAQRATESVRNQSQRAKVGFSHLLETQPLVIGVLGIAVGALIAGLLPSTRKENELMGEARDRLADKATSVAKETYAKAADAGRKFAEEAKEKVKENMASPTEHADRTQ